MASRSSRLFVVLLHLVGVARWPPRRPPALPGAAGHRHRHGTCPATATPDRGGGGVSGDLAAGRQRMVVLSPRRRRRRSSPRPPDPCPPLEEEAAAALAAAHGGGAPVWLQDDGAGDCLGPFGAWSDCGDASQWRLLLQPQPAAEATPAPARPRLVRKAPPTTPPPRPPPHPGAEVPPRPAPAPVWSLCLVEEPAAARRWPFRLRRHPRPVCLAAHAATGRLTLAERPKRVRQRHRPTGERGHRYRDDHPSTLWRIHPDHGYLQSAAGRSLCLWRRDSEAADGGAPELRLDSCELRHIEYYRKVTVSLIWYRTMPLSMPEDAAVPALNGSPHTGSRETPDRAASSRPRQFVPHHAHAYPTAAPSLAPAPFAPSPAGASPSRPVRPRPASMHPQEVLPLLHKGAPETIQLALLKDSNPILLTSRMQTTPMAMESPGQRRRQRRRQSPSISPAVGASGSSMKPHKIPIHPYFLAAQNEIWKDPSTGLEYATDLTRHLERTRQEHGRHSLMGVGQYIKGFVIKVYGIAFYVSKRDALADPALEPFAGLSAEELRQRPDFYQTLRTMGTSSGTFERTIVLKTNMQLSADTMRSSLHADWSQLTDEMKDLLLSSSMKPRPADEKMLEWIQSPENPSRCSCSSVAPPEYNADPNCCARGTELAFTWLRSGDLEVRMNGRVMDVFNRKDLAEGIFYEYLRIDDPISTDFRERVVDGFPFLLAPLAQVRGVHIGKVASKSHGNQILQTLTGYFEAAQSNAMAFGNIVVSHAVPLVSHAGQASNHAAESLGRAVKSLYIELESQKDALVDNIMSFPEIIMGVLSEEKTAPIWETVSDWMSANITPTDNELRVVRRDPLGRALSYPLSRWFSDTYQAPDEIAPMTIDPKTNTTRRFFLAFVHIYLFLIFIVSFPGSYSSRSRLTIRNNMVRLDTADNGSLSSCDESEAAEKEEKEFGTITMPASEDHETNRIPRRSSKLSILARSKRALKPSNLQDAALEESDGNDVGSRLKKKSLSYFL